MKKYFLFLVISTTLCMPRDVYGMEPELKEEMRRTQPTAQNVVFILPPEQMENVHKMNLLATLCPQIAQAIPTITTADEFEAAKLYLEYKKQSNRILLAGALYGPTINGSKTGLVEEYQRLLKELSTYIETLQGPSCSSFRSLEDEKAFKMSGYEAQYKIAESHLMLLVPLVLGPSLQKNKLVINSHLQEIKKIKENLSGSPQYRKQLQQAIKDVQESVPVLVPLFNPQMQLKTPQTRGQRGGRINQQRTVNYYQQNFQALPKNVTSGDSFQEVENFDANFQIKVKTILTEYLALSLKKLPSEEYLKHVQKLVEDYVSFEMKGISFKEFLSKGTSTFQAEILNSEDLTDLYRFCCQRYTLPHQNPLQLLENSIFMFIQANRVSEALTRTEALKTFLLEKGPLSDHFISLRASVMALNGDCEEWRKIIQSKRNKTQQEKADVEQQQINQLKEHQEKRKKEKEKADTLKKTPQIITNKKNRPETDHTNDVIIDHPAFSEAETKYEILHPREKIKTRNPAREPIYGEKSVNHNNSLSCKTLETPKVPKDYPLSNNAFKTYEKIRKGDWKFARKDLYNLFDKLKCVVDISQGKGVHGKISPPLNMTITNDEGLVAVIPEFIQGEVPFPLTVPEWDKNWSGIVPIYMRKCILNALDYLGATDETVHK